MIYPPNHSAQIVFWDDLQDELVSLINQAAPLVVEQAEEPTQDDWETAWVAAGNALPIIPNKRLVWFDGAQVRGEYAVIDGDYYVMLAQIRRPNNIEQFYYRPDGEIIGWVVDPPNHRTWIDGTDDPVQTGNTAQFFGIAELDKQGRVVSQIHEPIDTRIRIGPPILGIMDTYYRQSLDTLIGLELSADSNGISRRMTVGLRPTAGGAFVENSNTTGAPGATPSDSFQFEIYIGSTAAGSVTVTMSMRSVPTGTVLFSQGQAISANQRMTKYTISGTVPGGFPAEPLRFRLEFSTSVGAGERIWIAAPNFVPDTSVSDKYLGVPLYNPGSFFLNASAFNSNWTRSSVDAVTDTIDDIRVLFNFFYYNLDTDTPGNALAFKAPFHTFFDFAGTANDFPEYTRIIGIDSSGNVLISVPHSTNLRRVHQIWRYSIATDVGTVIYTAPTDGAWGAFYSEEHDKIIVDLGPSTAGVIMEPDGTGQITMTGLYLPQLTYGDYVYGVGQGTIWPSSERTVTWDIVGEAVVAFVPFHPNFDRLRERLVKPLSATMMYLGDRQSTTPQIATRPLLDLLPIRLEANPINADELLATYGPVNTQVYSEAQSNRFLNHAVAALIYENGSTGRVRRTVAWTSAKPDLRVLERIVPDVDVDEIVFDLTQYGDLDDYEILILALDNNCISANDTSPSLSMAAPAVTTPTTSSPLPPPRLAPILRQPTSSYPQSIRLFPAAIGCGSSTGIVMTRSTA